MESDGKKNSAIGRSTFKSVEKLQNDVGGSSPAHIQGNITIFDAPNVLEMGTMRWELSRNGSGCRLVFTDILAFEGYRSEDEITNSVLGGWHKYLDMLEYALNGGNGDPRVVPECDYSKITSLVSDT